MCSRAVCAPEEYVLQSTNTNYILYEAPNFHEKAHFVKGDLTLIAYRRSRLRQRSGGSGMAQG
jgi:hypothetical protein